MASTLIYATAILTTLSLPTMAEPGNPGAQFMQNWDTDEDGYVTLDEARDRREAIFSAFDADEDGTLSDEEYAILDEARAHDRDRQGQGQGQGMGQGRGKGRGQGPGRGQANDTVSRQPMGIGAGFAMDRTHVDLNQDGVVTREEFITSVETWFTSKDADHDGRLSVADFGRKG